jgi:hypothetical protein
MSCTQDCNQGRECTCATVETKPRLHYMLITDPRNSPAIEAAAHRMAGARAKHDDSYPSDLLAREEDDPR